MAPSRGATVTAFMAMVMTMVTMVVMMIVMHALLCVHIRRLQYEFRERAVPARDGLRLSTRRPMSMHSPSGFKRYAARCVSTRRHRCRSERDVMRRGSMPGGSRSRRPKVVPAASVRHGHSGASDACSIDSDATTNGGATECLVCAIDTVWLVFHAVATAACTLAARDAAKDHTSRVCCTSVALRCATNPQVDAIPRCHVGSHRCRIHTDSHPSIKALDRRRCGWCRCWHHRHRRQSKCPCDGGRRRLWGRRA
jgi:hypothetical protein